VTIVRGLEVRYRRLLRWFPRDHRDRHGEEMLGVLLAAAPAGKDRPGLAGSADLLWSAARMRLRPGRALSDPAGWRDALAMFSFVAPVLTVIAAVLSYATSNLLSEALGGGGMSFGVPGLDSWSPAIVHPVIATILYVIVYGQAVVALLALLGLRRCAAVAALVLLVYFATTGVAAVPLHSPVEMILQDAASLMVQFLALVVEIVALLASPGPRYGRRCMRPGHWAVAGLAVLPLAAYQFAYFGGGALWQARSAVRAILALAPAAVLLMIAAAWLASPAGKRFAVLLAVLGYPLLEAFVYRYVPSTLTSHLPFEVGLQIGVVLLLAVLVIRVRRARRGFGDSDGEGTGVA
jgi:hypothetical protein